MPLSRSGTATGYERRLARHRERSIESAKGFLAEMAGYIEGVPTLKVQRHRDGSFTASLKGRAGVQEAPNGQGA